MTTYRIADWDRRFETTRSRAMTNCRFVSVPLMLADRGYMRLMRKKDAAACFGVFVALAVWQMGRFDGRTRDGWLTDDGTAYGAPLTADDLAVELRMDELTVSVALDELSSYEVGLLEAHSPAPECEREEERGTIGGETEGERDGMTERKRERVAGGGSACPRAASPRLPPETDGQTRRPHPPAAAGQGLRPACAGSGDARRPMPEAGGRTTEALRQAQDRTDDGEQDALRQAQGRTDDGETEDAVSAPLAGVVGHEQQQHPASLLLSACAVEIPCQDGIFTPNAALFERWTNAYPDIDVTAQLLRMAAWAYGNLEAGGQAFYRVWMLDSAPSSATNWLAEEQQKVDAWKARGADPEADPKRRGAAGAPEGDWRREIESLDKLARGKRKRIADLEAKHHFCDDLDNRERYPSAWEEYRALKAEVDAITADMAKVKRSSGAKKGVAR